MKIGGHYFDIYNLSDLKKVIQAVKKSGANAFQIFNGDKSMTTLKHKAHFSAADFAAARKLLVGLTLVVHGNLTTNLGNPMTSGRYHWMYDNLFADLEFAAALGAAGCVIHVGYKTQTPSEAVAVKNMADNIALLLSHFKNAMPIVIETSAAQKNRIAVSIEGLRDLYQQIPKKYHSRIMFCIDSCHVFSAGYPIDTVKGVDDYFAKWDAEIGMDKLLMVHLNDSKEPIGSHINRHENLMEGYIFTESTLAEFLKFVKDKILILETRSPEKYAREITLVKRIAARLK